MKISKKIASMTVLFLSAVIVVAVYASITQTFPSVSIPPVPQATSSTCTTLSLPPPVLSVAFVPTPVTGTLPFGCPPMGLPTLSPAFTVSNADPAGSSFTPTFTLPAYYTRLAVTGPTSIAVCGSTADIPISTGVPVSLTNGGYFYCATYAGVPTTGATLGTFTVSWAP